MKEMKKSIVDETVGTLAAELESQELGEVNGGGSHAVISAITAITALSHNVTGRMSDTCLKAKHIRKCQKKYRIQSNVRWHSTLLRFRKNEL